MMLATSSKHKKYNTRDSNNYIVYDLKDNIVVSGNVKDLCKQLDIVKSTISKAVKNGSVVRRKWRIYYDN